jgi:ABC-type polysaccharide/polyol phosphate export permease
MTGLIEGFRASMLGRPVPWHLLWISGAICVGMFWVGVAYFRRTEYKFADLI